MPANSISDKNSVATSELVPFKATNAGFRPARVITGAFVAVTVRITIADSGLRVTDRNSEYNSRDLHTNARMR